MNNRGSGSEIKLKAVDKQVRDIFSHLNFRSINIPVATRHKQLSLSPVDIPPNHHMVIIFRTVKIIEIYVDFVLLVNVH